MSFFKPNSPPKLNLEALDKDDQGLDEESKRARADVVANHAGTTFSLLWMLSETFFDGLRKDRLLLAIRLLAELFDVWPLDAMPPDKKREFFDMYSGGMGEQMDRSNAVALIRDVSRGFFVAYGQGESPSATAIMCWIMHAMRTSCDPNWTFKDVFDVGTPTNNEVVPEEVTVILGHVADMLRKIYAEGHRTGEDTQAGAEPVRVNLLFKS